MYIQLLLAKISLKFCKYFVWRFVCCPPAFKTGTNVHNNAIIRTSHRPIACPRNPNIWHRIPRVLLVDHGLHIFRWPDTEILPTTSDILYRCVNLKLLSTCELCMWVRFPQMLTIMIYRWKIIVKAPECHGVSNHHWFDILFFRLCRVTEKRTQSSGCLPSDRSIPLRNAEYCGKRLISWYYHADRTWDRPGTPWWRHQMETFSALLAICAGNSPVPGEFPHKDKWRGALMLLWSASE